MKVLVTREEPEPLAGLVRARGHEPVWLPCIAREPAGADAALRKLANDPPDWIALASPYAAHCLAAELKRLGLAVHARFAAVGEATAAAVREAGLSADPFVSSGAGGAALAASLRARGERVSLPRAEHATVALEEGLRAAGALVEPFTLYRTGVPRDADLSVLAGGVDVILLASGSAARGLRALAPDLRARTVCIGATTADEARAAGLQVDAVGDGTVEGLLAAALDVG